MVQSKVTHDQIVQLAMEWYKPIIAEIQAEQESSITEVTEENIQSNQENTNPTVS